MHISRRGLLAVSAAAPFAPKVALGAATISVPEYLLTRLQQHGVKHLFGVPGATCDALFAAAASTLDVVVTSTDLEAGYAADAYARLRGLSAVSVTYGVGTLSLIAPIAGAFVERSPIVIINGGPSAEDLRIQRETGSLFSHSNGKEKSDLTMFREVTAYAGRAATPDEVPKIVDAALTAALLEKRPVYIEIAKHLWDAKCAAPGAPLNISSPGFEAALATKLQTSLSAAKKPAVLVGIEVQRFGLEEQVTKFLSMTGLPWATTFLAKGTLSEKLPGFAGVYAGERSTPEVKKLIEESDAVLPLGVVLGRQYRRLATRGALLKVNSVNVIAALNALTWTKVTSPSLADLSFESRRSSLKRATKTGAGLNYDEVMSAVSKQLDENSLVITDTSLSMYPAAELDLSRGSTFMCNAVWQAIGFSVAASVGAAIAQNKRPLVICGDGGFQMTAQALSTMARRQLPCTVLVLDNAIYGIEQFLLDASFFKDGNKPPKKYLELNAWKYTQLATAFGVQNTAAVATVDELRDALKTAKSFNGPTLIQVAMSPRDLPAGLS